MNEIISQNSRMDAWTVVIRFLLAASFRYFENWHVERLNSLNKISTAIVGIVNYVRATSFGAETRATLHESLIPTLVEVM